MARELYLIRHGQTAYNAQRRFQGQVDVPLDATGLDQARAVAHHLKDVGVTRIFSSDLTRAHDTAKELANVTGLSVTLDAGLREIRVGEWEGYTRDEILVKWPEELRLWSTGADVTPPGGESRRDSNLRVRDAVLRLMEQCNTEDVVAMFAHGAVIRGATELLMGLDQVSTTGPASKLGTLDNCQYVHFGIRDDVWMLRAFAGGAQV